MVQALGGIVDISVRDIDLVKQVWQKWLKLECCRKHPCYIDLLRQRKEMFRRENDCAAAVKVHRKELDEEYIESFDEWLTNGAFLQ